MYSLQAPPAVSRNAFAVHGGVGAGVGAAVGVDVGALVGAAGAAVGATVGGAVGLTIPHISGQYFCTASPIKLSVQNRTT